MLRYYLDINTPVIYVAEESPNPFCVEISIFDAYEYYHYRKYPCDANIDQLLDEAVNSLYYSSGIYNYMWASVVSELAKFDKLMYDLKYLRTRDYLLVLRRGKVEFLHSCPSGIEGIQSIKENGYKYPQAEKSFASGLYALPTSSPMRGNHNVFLGRYHGYYFECITDWQNGEKDGELDPTKRELFLPFDTETITWINS